MRDDWFDGIEWKGNAWDTLAQTPAVHFDEMATHGGCATVFYRACPVDEEKIKQHIAHTARFLGGEKVFAGKGVSWITPRRFCDIADSLIEYEQAQSQSRGQQPACDPPENQAGEDDGRGVGAGKISA